MHPLVCRCMVRAQINGGTWTHPSVFAGTDAGWRVERASIAAGVARPRLHRRIYAADRSEKRHARWRRGYLKHRQVSGPKWTGIIWTLLRGMAKTESYVVQRRSRRTESLGLHAGVPIRLETEDTKRDLPPALALPQSPTVSRVVHG
jgi:hypothetical protein